MLGCEKLQKLPFFSPVNVFKMEFYTFLSLISKANFIFNPEGSNYKER